MSLSSVVFEFGGGEGGLNRFRGLNSKPNRKYLLIHIVAIRDANVNIDITGMGNEFATINDTPSNREFSFNEHHSAAH